MSEFSTQPENQPDRCPSIDPHDTLQCGRRVHDDDQCQYGGIGWRKGTPRYVSDSERADSLEGMCERLAESHVDLQAAMVWALGQAIEWRDKMPRTRENDTYANGRQDGVDAVTRIVRAALAAHLRGENPPVPVGGESL